MAERLFGTDGVRGIAGTYPLEPVTVARIGAALVRAMNLSGSGAVLLLGRDTRESGAWIEREFARGVQSEGAGAVSAGVIPTPAIAYLTRLRNFPAGIVISASHNPYQDNGIKVFSGRGEKFTEALELEVERLVADRSWKVTAPPVATVDYEDVADAYVRHVQDVLPHPERLAGRRIVLDCANGATSMLAPRIFVSLGLDTSVINGSPDGRNINLNCGSTHLAAIVEKVVDGGYDVGVAFDGDGDRAILIDRRGRLVNGDAVLLACAKHFQASGRLRGNAVVATVMSNLGLEVALKELGIELVRCPVGDKYVMQEMAKRDLALGGEQSGHIIFSDYLFTGDGIATALVALDALASRGGDLASFVDELPVFPQVLKNLRVREKRDLKKVAPIAAAITRIERALSGEGRLLVRYSGTEPLLRVMIEGRDERQISDWAQEIIDEASRHLG
jgi:phosphoglucosamine mutase